MASPLFSARFDTLQSRLGRERLHSLAHKEDWDTGGLSSGVWIEPVYKDVMLNPIQRTPEWSTQGTGKYARLQLTDWANSDNVLLSTMDGFYVADDKFVGDTFICEKEYPYPIHTAIQYGHNTGFYLAYFSYGTGTDKSDHSTVRCGWDNGAIGLQLEFTAHGKARIYKSSSTVPDAEYGFTTGGNSGGQNTGKFIEVLIIPWRKRELLVVDNYGGHFSHVFDDIDLDDTNPTITPQAHFMVQFPGGAMKVQACPVQFLGAGYVVSKPSAWMIAPDAEENWTAGVFSDTYDGGTVSGHVVSDKDGTSIFQADGSSTMFRLRANLASGAAGFASPFVYGIEAGYEPIPTNTVNTPTPIDMNYVVEASFNISEHPASTKYILKIRNPDLLDTQISSNTGGEGSYTLWGGCNRPAQWLIGDALFHDGATLPPEIEVNENEDVDYVTIESRDVYKQLEDTTFADAIPLDGKTLTEALLFVTNTAGIPASKVFIEDNAYTLSLQGPEWNVLIQEGDSCAHWWERLIETFAGDWMHGAVPQFTYGGPVLQAGSMDYWGSESRLTLYHSLEAAIEAGYSADQNDDNAAWKFVYRKYRERTLEPEANRIIVTGWDPNARRPFQIVKNDYNSQNPALSIPSRPDNWIGGLRKYGLIDPAITSKALGIRVTNLLYNRLTPKRTIGEWEAPLPLDNNNYPLWRGDLLTLDQQGTFRINSMSGRVHSNNAFRMYAPTTFTGAKNLQLIGRTAGTTLDEIHAQHQLRLSDKIINRSRYGSRTYDLVSIPSQDVILI